MANRGSILRMMIAGLALALAGPLPAQPAGPLKPLVQLNSVPITSAIRELAKNAEINYLIVPALAEKWQGNTEPLVTFTLTNISAKEVLQKMLAFRGIALIENPAANIAVIAPANWPTNTLFDHMGAETSADHTNVIPLIDFADVPIRTAIEHLAAQAAVPCIMDPDLLHQWTLDEPFLSFRLRNVTAWDTLNALLNIRGLSLVTGQTTPVARVTFRNQPWPAPDLGLLGFPTNNPPFHTNSINPLIQFEDAPLDTALSSLIDVARANDEIKRTIQIRFDPKIQQHIISVSWENLTAEEAITALCGNYDLVLASDEATGAVIIKPNPYPQRRAAAVH